MNSRAFYSIAVMVTVYALGIVAPISASAIEPRFIAENSIEESALSNYVRYREFATARNSGLFFAKLGESDVFVKSVAIKDAASTDAFVREAEFVKLLSDEKIGPQFFGVKKTDTGYAIVTRKISGINLRNIIDEFRNSHRFTKRSVDSLERMLNFLKRRHRTDYLDFQMRMDTETGQIFVIDAGLFVDTEYDTANFATVNRVNQLLRLAKASVSYRRDEFMSPQTKALFDFLLPQARSQEYAAQVLPAFLTYFSEASQEGDLTSMESVNFVPFIYDALNYEPNSLFVRARTSLGIPGQVIGLGPAFEVKYQKLLMEVDGVLKKTDATNSSLLKNENFMMWWKQVAPKAQRRMERAEQFTKIPIIGTCMWFLMGNDT